MVGGEHVLVAATEQLSHITPAYKRALWIVVLLNIGYGVIEAVGGFISGSQALKADALDFAAIPGLSRPIAAMLNWCIRRSYAGRLKSPDPSGGGSL